MAIEAEFTCCWPSGQSSHGGPQPHGPVWLI
jgi:hypothetical protein